MDLSDKDKFGLEMRDGDPLNYHSSNMSSDWRFGSANHTNASLGLVPTENSMAVCKGDMVDTFCPTLWDHPNSQNLGFCNTNVQASTSNSNSVGIRKGIPGVSRTGFDKDLEMGWNLPSSISKGGLFSQTGAGILPQSLSHFPADSAFIERAARFSCFNGGNFSDMVNPFGISESPSSSYSRGGEVIRGLPEFLSGNNGLKPLSGAQPQKNESNKAEFSKDVSLSVEHGATEGSPIRNERENRGFVRPSDEAKQAVGASSNDPDEAEFSGGGGGQEEPSMLANADGEPFSAKELGSKKRNRSGHDTVLDQVKGSPKLPGEAAKDSTEIKQKGDQNPTPTTTKPTGKHGKDSSQASDAPKEDYIHVRARRGEATNSHSLAERVRREKISERMKFLQDLVPGCSKVTGKAVMLDEIINYVQSLQRQVEFLSMKLAAVNPRLDFNIEGLLAKDVMQSQGAISSTMGFSSDMGMAHHLLHPSQQGLIQAGIPGMGNPSDTLRRTINSQFTALNGSYKEPTAQDSGSYSTTLESILEEDPVQVIEMNGNSPAASNRGLDLGTQREEANAAELHILDKKFTTKWAKIIIVMSFTGILSLLSLSYTINNGKLISESPFKQHSASLLMFLIVLMIVFYIAIIGVVFREALPVMIITCNFIALVLFILSFTVLLWAFLPQNLSWAPWVLFTVTIFKIIRVLFYKYHLQACRF